MTSSGPEQDPVPRALKEAVELIKSANRRFEDCAVGWQSKISHEQWKLMANANRVQDKSWEDSVLARTYFADKTLDDSFKSLLTYDKATTDCLQNFITLLRGEESQILPMGATVVQSRSSNQEENTFIDTSVAPFNLAVAKDHRQQNEIKSTDRTEDAMTRSDIEPSFSDLIKAKINFDMKFLDFEATLNSTAYTATSANNTAPSCLCQICSNVLVSTASTCASKKNSRVKSVTKRRSRRTTVRTNIKRLVKRSAGTSIREREKNQSVSLTEIGNGL
ncbi:uncharacterized protein LOC107264694 isoform X2 [Cephus cinctus]|uniref:Uncharacterized protein LOC107264694 isoform X2 n=1 Tax=Cephus cinctus TaxID=211228 RepID=A0AAJ7RB56_CEPCN|nr:uncharacterized protein LOC107264694 isoform X2 [Cephus cinctus]